MTVPGGAKVELTGQWVEVERRAQQPKAEPGGPLANA